MKYVFVTDFGDLTIRKDTIRMKNKSESCFDTFLMEEVIHDVVVYTYEINGW